MAEWYGLDGQPISIAEADALLPDSARRTVARTMITTDRGRVEVSTVFLVLDHGWDDGPPVLWETMTFGGPDDLATQRYRSVQDAIDGHADIVTATRTALDIEGVRIVAEEHIDGPAAHTQDAT